MIQETILPEKVCDLAYLIDLSNGNENFVQEMISIFLSEVTSEVSTLEKGIIDGDYDAIISASHRLRSTIPFVGIDKLLFREMHTMEQLATERQDLDYIEKLFLKVKKVCNQAINELKE